MLDLLLNLPTNDINIVNHVTGKRGDEQPLVFVASWYMTVYIWHGYNTQLRLVMLWKQYEFRPHFSPIRLMCNCFFRWGILLLFDSDVYELSWLERYFCSCGTDIASVWQIVPIFTFISFLNKKTPFFSWFGSVYL